MDASDLLKEVLKRYNSVEGLVEIDKVIEITKKELDGTLEEEEDYEPIKPEPKQTHFAGEGNTNSAGKKIDMKTEFWDTVEIDSGEFPPWFKIQNRLTYRLRLKDPNAEPRPHKDKTFNRSQWIWEVVLVDVDAEALKEKDKDGNPLYVKGKEYSLALGKRAMQRFRSLWAENDFKITEFTMKRIGTNFQTDYIFGV
jgi:hypothetical protein